MMKRLFALLLTMCMLLCACGNDEVQETSAPTTVPTTTQAPTTEATTVPTTEATTAPTEPLPTHPLTGEVLTEPFTGRPVASTINNAVAAMPQHGISQADWFFEIETEGDVTRGLGIFTDLDNIDVIGPVRSARTYMISLATSLGAPLAHCGGSPYALEGQYAYYRYLDVYRDIDEMGNPSYFFRDTARRSQGYAYEHTLFTTGEGLKQAMIDKGFDDVVDEAGMDYGYQFQENVELDGNAAKDITISFRGGKKTYMTLNSDTGLYEAAQYGSDWIDGTTGEVVSYDNVIVLYAEQDTTTAPPHTFYQLQGEGTGYLAIDGQIVSINWSRGDVHDPFTLTLEDGTPVTLNTGRTYCAIISTRGSVTFG